VADYVDQFQQYWKGLQREQRIIMSVAVVAALAIPTGVAWYGYQDQFEEIYSSRDRGEVQDVRLALEAQGITDYRISNDGFAILVPPEYQGQALIASASVVGKVPGYEVLDNIELGTSPQRERWAWQRALQGELARTINSLEEVEWSRVHLVMPERTAFLRDENPPSASVTVKLASGERLTSAQIGGITALVGGAVDGLRSSDVVLVDHDGRLLSGGDNDDGPLSQLPKLLQLRKAEENRTRDSIMDALTRVLGSPHEVTVGVTVDVNTSSTDSLKRSQDPESQVLISETVREDSSNSSQPLGTPGTESNLPEETAEEQSKTTNQETLEQRSNYAYTQMEEREVTTAGTIERVSVGVVVNSERVADLAAAMVPTADGAAPDEAAIAKKVSALESQIEDTVRVAMGYNDDRADSLVVTFLPFSATNDTDFGAMEENTSSLAWAKRNWLKLANLSMVLATIFGVFLFVLGPLIRSITQRMGPAQLTAEDAGELVDRAVAAAGPDGERLAESIARRGASKNLTERLRAMVDNFETVDAADLNRLVDLEQEATAQVLRRWLTAENQS